MNLKVDKMLRVFLLGMAFFLAVTAAMANGGVYILEWWTVDGGGAFSMGNSYTLGGTAGQPEAGLALTGGGYTLVGGLWAGASSAAAHHAIYLPLVVKAGG